ncbi:MAG: GTP-binding protein LepA [Propionibacteriaceae bacterium]|nr:GTP-binding protein LepA [Propionibacteriaceae bacterium]
MARSSRITDALLLSHVNKMGEEHPPVPWESVDFTVHDPAAMRTRFAGVLDYLARVELEVERNVLELLTIMPNPSEADRVFYADVWYGQEIQHGLILDELKSRIGLPASEPLLQVGFAVKALGAMARFEPIQDVARTIYYLTGASTERQAVLAYNAFGAELDAMGEKAVRATIINPIKRQEPGHFAFYRMSAEKITTDGTLKPWQMWLARKLRTFSYELVGTHQDPRYQAQMGEVITKLGFERDLEVFAKEIGRLEASLLWAQHQGLDFPPYVLAALRESVELYRERGDFTPNL